MKEKGLIFNIERFSLNDGPGIRTVIFLKGCPLRCFWCQNPEGLNPKIEIQFNQEHCILCRTCEYICPTGAHKFIGEEHVFQREKCIGCGQCVRYCPAKALRFVGREVSVSDVMEEVLEDLVYYKLSNGGITLSGGEPLMQHEFSKALLKECKAIGVHTAIETSLFASWNVIKNIISYTDLVMFDIKHIDPDIHKKVTGVSNELILKNAEKLLFEENIPIIVRTPIVPTVNDDEKIIQRIAEFIKGSKNLIYYELLPFHKLGESKYKSLGLEYRAKSLKPPSKEKMTKLLEAARNAGINVKMGKV